MHAEKSDLPDDFEENDDVMKNRNKIMVNDKEADASMKALKFRKESLTEDEMDTLFKNIMSGKKSDKF